MGGRSIRPVLTAATVVSLLAAAAGCGRAPYFVHGGGGTRELPAQPKEVFVVFREGDRTRATLIEVRTEPETLLVLVRRDVEMISRPETLEVPLSDIERMRPPDHTSGSWVGMLLFLPLIVVAGLFAIFFSVPIS
jgi:hypothetical protein